MNNKTAIGCLLQIKRGKRISEELTRELIIQGLVVKKDDVLMLTEKARRFIEAWFNPCLV